MNDDEVAGRGPAGPPDLLVDRLAAIVDVWRELSERYHTVDELLDVVPEVALGILGAGGAMLFRRNGDQLVPLSFAGELTDAPRIPLAGSLAGWVYHHQVATRSEDYIRDPRTYVVGHRNEINRGLVAAPIPGPDEPVGVIVVLDPRAGRFDEADERTLDLLARALGTLVRRLEVEVAHRRLDERLQLVVDATTDAIYDWQVEEERVWWSAGAVELFGHPVEFLAESVERWAELLHPDERRMVVADLRTALADPQRTSWSSTYRFRRADGSYVHMRDRAHIRRHPDGRPSRIIGGMTDVSELVEAEARTLRSQRLEAVGQLTGGLAHDFNNLLTVVLGNADQLIGDLIDRSGEPDELVELAEMVRTAALRGAELARQLLAFAGRQPLDPRPTDVNAFVADFGRLLRRTIPESIDLDLRLGEFLPDVVVDRGQLEQALLNLCLNARDAMPDGGRLGISTELSDAGPDADAGSEVRAAAGGGPVSDDASGVVSRHVLEYVTVTVTDSGTGIPPELMSRVVEPFFTTKPPGIGSGLGLSSVHGFAVQSGGALQMRSEAGRGTEVRLFLPAARLPHDNSGPIVRPAAPTAHAGERILVVEDDLLVRQLAVRQLTSLGYEVYDAANGHDALELLQVAGPVDLLFTDVVMPGGMDGKALAEAAAAHQPGLPVLFTSGYSQDAIVHDGRLDPGLALLVKPYRLTDLARRVREVLDPLSVDQV